MGRNLRRTATTIYRLQVWHHLYPLTHTDYSFTGNRKHATLGDPDDVDEDGLLIDVDVQSVDSSPACTREDKRKDVDHFFHGAIVKIVKGKAKKYRDCKACP